MPEPTSSVTDSLKAGNRVVAFGIAAIVIILLGAALFLFLNLPDANAPAEVAANRFYGYGVVARLALLAASIELERTDPDQSLYG